MYSWLSDIEKNVNFIVINIRPRWWGFQSSQPAKHPEYVVPGASLPGSFKVISGMTFPIIIRSLNALYKNFADNVDTTPR